MDACSRSTAQRQSFRTFRPQFSLRSLLLAVLAVGVGLGACQLANVRLPHFYTGRQLDVAIQGPGYFELAQGDFYQSGFYTRGGRFWVDEHYQIRYGTREQDLYLHPHVSIPCDSQAGFDPDGSIYAHEANAPLLTTVGACVLTHFPNPDGLEEVLPGIYRRTEAAGIPVVGSPGVEGLGTCLPGWIELRDSQRKNSAIAISPVVIIAFALGAGIGVFVPRRARRRNQDA